MRQTFSASVALVLLLPFLAFSQVNSTETEHDACYRNCTGKTVDPFCASDGNTYDNRCQMRVAACRAQKDIEFREDGPCISPEPKGEVCEDHRIRIIQNKRTNDPTWSTKCNNTLLLEKSERDELVIEDLIECYLPVCTLGSYQEMQCYSLGSRRDPTKWCWCSSDTGVSIPDTLSKNMTTGYCSQRSSCHYEGAEYPDGKAFIPEHQCGVCECLDGNVTCFEDFVPDIQGRLNQSQLSQLSSLLRQFYYFEYSHRDSILRDIRKISALVADISDDVLRPILDDWFHHYDSNGNGMIEFNHTEETTFHSHIAHFTACKHFLDHVSEVFDGNSSGGITLVEWHSFFNSPAADEEEPPVISRRSASNVALPRSIRRTIENRKKFYYVLTL